MLNIFAAVKSLLLIVATTMYSLLTLAQVTERDTLLVKDSAGLPVSTFQIDTVAKDSAKVKTDSLILHQPSQPAFDKTKYIQPNRFFNMQGKGVWQLEQFAVAERKDWLFYLIVGLLFFFSVIRLSYLRYFNNLFRLFFKTTLRQNQVREQLMQSQLSGLLFNLFFFIAGGIYLFLLLQYYNVSLSGNRWQLLGACIGSVAVLYSTKYMVLKSTGWVFGIKEAIETYSFIVFLVNKVLGILLLPFIVLLAFSTKVITEVAVTLSLLMVAGMFLYRFIRSYIPIRNEIKVSRFHFFLYLCAFEITPLLLIYKVLLNFF